MLLVYIPYYAMSEEIKLQQNRNNALQMQLDMLIEETPQTSEVPVVQLEYNRAYSYIMNQQDVFTSHLLDITNLQSPSVILTSYQVRPETNEIAIYIQADTEQELYEFIISLYESHGVIDEPTLTRWITKTPTYRFTATLTMEVTISYA